MLCPKDADGMANIVDPDQTAPILFASEQSDLGLHCLLDLFLGPVCPKNLRSLWYLQKS